MDVQPARQDTQGCVQTNGLDNMQQSTGSLWGGCFLRFLQPCCSHTSAVAAQLPGRHAEHISTMLRLPGQ
jgi:hypothetical protein